MNIYFSQLEQARKNPAKFGSNHSTKKPFYNSRNFRTYLVGAIKRFHDGKSKSEVLHFFEEKCTDKLSHLHYFQVRLKHYLKALGTYCDTYAEQSCQFVEAKKAVHLKIEHHIIHGKIERFDIKIPSGYRATATQLEEVDWVAELRWPLMQKAIATEIGCPTSEVEIGVFCFATGNYDYCIFNDETISAAEKEAKSVLSKVEENLPVDE